MAASSEILISTPDMTVTSWVIAPGESTGPHTHEWDYSVVPVSEGLAEAVSGDTRLRVPMQRDTPYFREAGATHDLVNVGDTTIRFIEVEFIR